MNSITGELAALITAFLWTCSSVSFMVYRDGNNDFRSFFSCFS